NAGGIFEPLIEHWDGASWRVVPSPAVGNAGGELLGVAARSANDAWAVGTSHTNLAQDQGQLTQPLIMHWNGADWKVVSSPTIADPPNSSPAFAVLDAVAALATNNVWAVGGNSSGGSSLVEHWNGARWSVVAQVPNGFGGALTSISARSA